MDVWMQPWLIGHKISGGHLERNCPSHMSGTHCSPSLKWEVNSNSLGTCSMVFVLHKLYLFIPILRISWRWSVRKSSFPLFFFFLSFPGCWSHCNKYLVNAIFSHKLFFKLINLFSLEANYFIIWYWFCHVLTWINHGCTCVPHPETLPTPSPSHPSGLSQCTSPECLSHALNLC